jgi:predicted O-methyltransferase YrrM
MAQTSVTHRAERAVRQVTKRAHPGVKRLRFYRKQLRGRLKRAGGAQGVAQTAWQRRFRPTYARSAARVPVRAELPHLLNARGLLGRGAEIGVMKGNYSAHILREWRGRELISVDPWLERPENAEHARTVLGAFGDRSRIVQATSTEAAAEVPDRDLDFAYIDALHDYDSVKADLEAWFPKVRPGGILAGHDYPMPGVRAAVDEFFAARSLPVHAMGEEPTKSGGGRVRQKNSSWIVEIPS